MSTKSFTADLFAIPSAPNREQMLAAVRNSRNPYAYYEVFGTPDDGLSEVVPEPLASVPSSQREGKLSKKVFQEGCRRIFRQYVPPAEGQVLRPQYRDFIDQNERRAPEERFRLLEGLSRYDLAVAGGLKPHFNREIELLTAAKLRQIEEVALKTAVLM